MSKKITFIGAGSLDFTRDLVRDILTFDAFKDVHFALMDIDEKRLQYARRGVEGIVEKSGCGAKVSATMNRREALTGADGVLITILQGGVSVWRNDIEIPKKYGVDMCVGDTRGVSGIFRFLRTAPVLLDIIRDVEDVCPNAVVLNYTNPMAMLVKYLQEQSNVNVNGLCHSVQGTAQMLAGWIGEDVRNIEYMCAGINHQAFYLEFMKDGVDLYPRIDDALRNLEIYNQEIIRNNMYYHLGYYTTESSGHVSEYTSWYRKRPELIETYTRDGTGWNPGEYGAILKEYLEAEDTWERDYTQWLQSEEVDLARGEEYASNIFNAIFGDNTPFYFNGNIKNRGYITNVKADACVEVPVVAERSGIRSVKAVTLPDHLAILVNLSAGIEDLAVKAAIEGDPMMAFRAILMDPLCGAVLTMDAIRDMVQEMLFANEVYLQYFKALKIK